MDHQLSVEEAISLLEITDIDSLSESSLIKIRRRAQRRWHPDRIRYMKPSEETVKRFEANFVRINDAVEVIRRLLAGEANVSSKSTRYDDEPSITPEEASRKYASENQETLRRVWERVKSSSYDMIEEEVVLSGGRTIKELLDQDLADEIPVTALASLWVGLVVYLVAALVVGIISFATGPEIGDLLLGLVSIAWLLQALASILALIPLSRVWLPESILAIVGRIVDQTFNLLLRTEHETWSIWVFGLPLLLIYATNWLIIKPVYKIVGLLLSSVVVGRIAVKMKYYAGVSEDYLNHLMTGDCTAFTQEELFDLAHAASRLAHA